MSKKNPQPEADYRMSVLSYEKRDRACSVCKTVGIIYVCHGFNLPWSEFTKIREMCRPCAEREAGGGEHVWVKTTFQGLRKVWATGKREWISEKKAEALAKARSAQRAH